MSSFAVYKRSNSEMLRGKTIAEAIEDIRKEANIVPYSHADILLTRLEAVCGAWKR
jgi:hypothetical protein